MAVELVPVRNKHTGLEKMVPPLIAERLTTEDCFRKDWEIIREGEPTPHQVVQYQEKLKKGEDPQPVVVTKIEATDPETKDTTKEVSELSVRQLTDQVEYLTFEQLDSLKDDERVSVRRLVEKELTRRENEKSTVS